MDKVDAHRQLRIGPPPQWRRRLATRGHDVRGPTEQVGLGPLVEVERQFADAVLQQVCQYPRVRSGALLAPLGHSNRLAEADPRPRAEAVLLLEMQNRRA